MDKVMLTQLRKALATKADGRSSLPAFSSGCPPLDRLLPRGGFCRGSLIEWLSDSPGAGASLLALIAARAAQRDGGAIVVIDRDFGFYPPAAVAWELDLDATLVVHPANEADERWALDQSLRCPHAAAVIAWPRRLDERTFRRLQLAAENSGSVGLLVRPPALRRRASWADVQLMVRPQASVGGWQLTVELVRARGRFGKATGIVALQIDELTGEIHEAIPGNLAAELAYSAPPPRQA